MKRRTFLTTAAAGVAAAVAPPTLFAEGAPGRSYKIIGFTKPFQKLSFEDTAETVAQVGWDGIECPVRPQGQIEPERAAEELPRLVEALKKRGKELSVMATSINRLQQPHSESLLRLAAKLGIRRYRLGFWKYAHDKSIPQQLDEIAVDLRELAALNRELGMQAGFQNHSGRDSLGAPVWDIWTMIKNLDPRDIGLCYDIGHATIEGGTSWAASARLVERQLTAVFVKDFVWQKTAKGWQEKWVPLGEGMVNPTFFTWLKTTRFDGPICQHHEYDHGAGAPMIAKMQQDLKVLRDWLSG